MIVANEIFLSVNFTAEELGYLAGLLIGEHNYQEEKDPATYSIAYKISQGLKKRKFNPREKDMIKIVCDDLDLIVEAKE